MKDVMTIVFLIAVTLGCMALDPQGPDDTPTACVVHLENR